MISISDEFYMAIQYSLPILYCDEVKYLYTRERGKIGFAVAKHNCTVQSSASAMKWPGLKNIQELDIVHPIQIPNLNVMSSSSEESKDMSKRET